MPLYSQIKMSHHGKKKDIATMVSENGKIYYSKGGKQEGIFRLITTNNEENIDKFHKKKSVLIKNTYQMV